MKASRGNVQRPVKIYMLLGGAVSADNVWTVDGRLAYKSNLPIREGVHAGVDVSHSLALAMCAFWSWSVPCLQ